MKKELLFSITKKDFKIDWFSGKGAGGQHRNKHQNCVRLTHLDSKVTITGQSHRERSKNLQDAFSRLVIDKRFKTWLKIESARQSGKLVDIHKEVDRLTQPNFIKVEERVDGKWIEKKKGEL